MPNLSAISQVLISDERLLLQGSQIAVFLMVSYHKWLSDAFTPKKEAAHKVVA